MRNGRDVPNHGEIEADGLQSADSGFTAGARTAHENFHFLQAMAHRLTGCVLRDHLRCVSGALARAFEADLARARPANHVAVQVGDGDDRVIKSGKDVRDAGMNVLASLRLDDFRLLDVVRVEREIFFGSLNRGGRFFFAFAGFFSAFGAAAESATASTVGTLVSCSLDSGDAAASTWDSSGAAFGAFAFGLSPLADFAGFFDSAICFNSLGDSPTKLSLPSRPCSG